MSSLIEEINNHLIETRQRFDDLEHAMIALADLVGQLVEKQAKNERPNRKDFLDATEKRRN
jgi:uncharacterized coiled-coil protein SlyX